MNVGPRVQSPAPRPRGSYAYPLPRTVVLEEARQVLASRPMRKGSARSGLDGPGCQPEAGPAGGLGSGPEGGRAPAQADPPAGMDAPPPGAAAHAEDDGVPARGVRNRTISLVVAGAPGKRLSGGVPALAGGEHVAALTCSQPNSCKSWSFHTTKCVVSQNATCRWCARNRPPRLPKLNRHRTTLAVGSSSRTSSRTSSVGARSATCWKKGVPSHASSSAPKWYDQTP